MREVGRRGNGDVDRFVDRPGVVASSVLPDSCLAGFGVRSPARCRPVVVRKASIVSATPMQVRHRAR